MRRQGLYAAAAALVESGSEGLDPEPIWPEEGSWGEWCAAHRATLGELGMYQRGEGEGNPGIGRSSSGLSFFSPGDGALEEAHVVQGSRYEVRISAELRQLRT